MTDRLDNWSFGWTHKHVCTFSLNTVGQEANVVIAASSSLPISFMNKVSCRDSEQGTLLHSDKKMTHRVALTAKVELIDINFYNRIQVNVFSQEKA